jgi:hypothetical protein
MDLEDLATGAIAGRTSRRQFYFGQIGVTSRLTINDLWQGRSGKIHPATEKCGSTAANQRAFTRTVREDDESAPQTKPRKQAASLSPVSTRFVVLAIFKDFGLCWKTLRARVTCF